MGASEDYPMNVNKQQYFLLQLIYGLSVLMITIIIMKVMMKHLQKAVLSGSSLEEYHLFGETSAFQLQK